jgi:hypothetical protein
VIWNLTASVIFINRFCQVTLTLVVPFHQTSSLKMAKMRVTVKVYQNNLSCLCCSMTSCSSPVFCQLYLRIFETILVRLVETEVLSHMYCTHVQEHLGTSYCEIKSSCCDVTEDLGVQQCDAVSLGEWFVTFEWSWCLHVQGQAVKTLEDEGTMILQHIANHSHRDTASHLSHVWRLNSST